MDEKKRTKGSKKSERPKGVPPGKFKIPNDFFADMRDTGKGPYVPPAEPTWGMVQIPGLAKPVKQPLNGGELPMFNHDIGGVDDLPKALIDAYGVKVEWVDSNADFFSERTIARTIKENVFFVSRENPVDTANISAFLIQYTKIRNRLLLNEPNEAVKDSVDIRDRAKQLLEVANSKRTEQTTRLSAELGQRIIEIADEYKHAHPNKKPSLNKIAEILNSRNVPTPGGGKNWAAVTVSRIVERNKLEL